MVAGEVWTSIVSYRDLDDEVDYESDKPCQCSLAKVSIFEKLGIPKSSDGWSMTAQLLLTSLCNQGLEFMNKNTHYQRL